MNQMSVGQTGATPGGVSPLGRTGMKKPSGYSMYQMPQYTPEQQQQFQNQFSHIGPGSYLSNLASGDQSAFEQMEAPARRQFSALQGNMGSRFAGMGQGALRSSGFKNAMTQAGSEFAQDLQAKRMQTRMDALRELMDFSNQIMGQKPYDVGFAEKQQKPGFWTNVSGGFAQGLGEGIPKAAAAYFGGG